MHHYTHITASPLYTSHLHTIERLSRSSWQITSLHLSSPITAKTYAEAKALAAEIDFNALSVKRAEPEPVVTNNPANYIKRGSFVVTNDAIYTDRDAPGQADRMTFSNLEVDEDGYVTAQPDPTPAINPFEAILTEASTITDLGDMQPAYDQAVRECDLCAVLGHISGQSLGDVFRGRFRLAVEAARAKVPDYARVIDLAGLLTGEDSMLWARVACDAKHLVDGAILPLPLIESLCDLPDTAGYIKRALILWACSVGIYGDEASWVARLRLEGAALRHAREVEGKGRVAQESKSEEGVSDMGGDRAREWGEVWEYALSHGDVVGESDDGDRLIVDGMAGVDRLMPNLLSPEPEHWLPVGDGRVLIINWRGGEYVGEVISAAVWLDDGGLSLLGSYVIGSGWWASVDRLREEDIDSEALGVILEAIARAGLAAIA